jgi:ubiquitin-protein ligase
MNALRNKKRPSNTDQSVQAQVPILSRETESREQTKKLRITVSAGEIRLKKDVTDFLAMRDEGVEIVSFDDARSITVKYRDPPNGVHLPNIFRISVQKYYPHDRPNVFSLELGFRCAEIGDDGAVYHPNLNENWSPIGSLLDILCDVNSIRGKLYMMQMPTFQPPLDTMHLTPISAAFVFGMRSCFGEGEKTEVSYGVVDEHNSVESIEDCSSMQIRTDRCATPSFVDMNDNSALFFGGSFQQSMKKMTSTRTFPPHDSMDVGSNFDVTAVHPQMSVKVSNFRSNLHSVDEYESNASFDEYCSGDNGGIGRCEVYHYHASTTNNVFLRDKNDGDDIDDDDAYSI